MYNLRYHIASLVAVFLALSVGLVLGSIVVERGAVDRQREALVASLQKEFARINEDNKLLQAQADGDAEFMAEAVPQLVDGTLAGRTVLVLTNSGRTDGLTSAQDAIRAAGGTPAVAMLQEKGLGLDRSEVSEAASRVLAPLSKSASLLDSVVASLAAEWASPAEDRPMTDALAEAGALRLKDLSPGTAARGLVVLAAWEQTPDGAALALAKAMLGDSVVVVGAEQIEAGTGVAQAFASEGLSAVNDLGSPRGEYSLARLLTGDVGGFYGTGTATDGPFAPTAEPITSQ